MLDSRGKPHGICPHHPVSCFFLGPGKIILPTCQPSPGRSCLQRTPPTCQRAPRKPPDSANGCSLMNANTTAADCDVSNDVHFPTREAMPAAAQAIMKAAGPRARARVAATREQGTSSA